MQTERIISEEMEERLCEFPQRTMTILATQAMGMCASQLAFTPIGISQQASNALTTSGYQDVIQKEMHM